ncbi:MAG: hypothetical protein KDK70_01020 [Myxococcales bacterium]|nr:hypothetical protein [Myxococcales bacterium]
MTTDTPKASQSEKEEQSFLPTLLAGAGILAVAALLIFWPSDDDQGKEGARNRADAADGSNADAPGGAAGGRPSGVGSRPVDAATQPVSTGRRNPALKLPEGRNGMAPVPPPAPRDPPANATVDEKIDFYEKRLDEALRIRESREKFAERLPSVQARIEASPNPEEGMKTFEKRKKVVEDNYEKAKKDVEEIERKLAELRGEPG